MSFIVSFYVSFLVWLFNLSPFQSLFSIFKASKSTCIIQASRLHSPYYHCPCTAEAPQLLEKPTLHLPLHSVQSTSYENLGNSDAASSQGIIPLVYRYNTQIQTDWLRWKSSPLEEEPCSATANIYNNHFTWSSPKGIFSHLPGGKEIFNNLSVFRH